MTASMPTRGQLERTLAQRIQALYRTQLGHQPSRVICQIFDGRIAIILENSITVPEQALLNQGKHDLAEQVRAGLEAMLDGQLRQLIQEVVGVMVIDLLTDATLETGRTGTIAILEASPQVRASEVISRIRKGGITVPDTDE